MNTKSIILRGLAVLCLLTSVLCFTGCATGGEIGDSKVIQAVLNQVLPPGFEGDLQGNHDGFYFGTSVHLDVDLRGLKKVGDHWTWTSGGYKRSGFFSTGAIKLTPSKPQ